MRQGRARHGWLVVRRRRRRALARVSSRQQQEGAAATKAPSLGPKEHRNRMQINKANLQNSARLLCALCC